VAQYINDFLTVAVPAVVNGIGDDIIMIILEEEVIDEERREVSRRILERFEFKFDVDGTIRDMDRKPPAETRPMYLDEDDENYEETEAMRRDAQIVNEARTQLEYSMKQCLLSVLALQPRKKYLGEKTSNLCFKLCMRTADGESNDERIDVSQKTCPQLIRALKAGRWYEPNESSCLVSGRSRQDEAGSRRGLLRPIKDVKMPNCGVNMSLVMEVG
jgi:hypothetical protein